jgi:hypothetical protein
MLRHGGGALNTQFDPYHKWLAIPPEEQPPDAYRLLGVKRFEADADVIANAADRQMAHIKLQASGPHAQHCQLILNELAQARQCLLDSQRKAEYDRWLYQQFPPPLSAPRSPAVTPSAPHREATAAQPAPAIESAAADGSGSIISQQTAILAQPKPSRRSRKSAQEKLSHVQVIGHIVAPLLGLALGYLLLRTFVWDREPPAAADSRPTATSTDANHRRREPLPRVEPRAPKSSPVANPPEARQDPSPTPAAEKSPVDAWPAVADVLPDIEEAGKAAPAKESQSTSEPSRPLAPFDRLPNHLEIPPLGTPGRTTLANVDVPPDKSLRLALFSPPLADGPESTFRLGEGRAGSQRTTWQVLMVRNSDDAGGAAETQEIGELEFAKDALTFQWGAQAHHVPASQLRNCLLTMQVGEHRKALALRKPIATPPLSLILKKTGERHSLTLADPPPEKLVYFQITSSTVVLPRHRYDPDSRVVAAGIPLKIQFSEPRDAELRLKTQLRGEELSIEVDGVYTLENRKYPLTEERVNKQLLSLQTQATEGQAELEQLQNDMIMLGERLEELRNMTIPRGRAIDRINEQRKRDLQLSALYKQQKKNLRRQELLEKKLPRMEEVLEQVPQIVELGNLLQTDVKFHYRVFLAWDYYEVLLVASDANAPASSEPPGDLGDADTEAIRQAQARLAADPADPEANFQLGLHYCLHENDWEKGLTHLRLGNDTALAAAARLDLDLDDPSNADAQVAMADRWYELARQDETRRDFLARAAHWYRSALPQLAGLKQIKVEKRLAKIDQE